MKKIELNKAVKHFITITEHKTEVMKGCFKVGLYVQGLLHDMSKYSPAEFLTGARYYQGDRSPNNAEREDTGYSSAWLHHKGRNMHHYEYWVDYNSAADMARKGITPKGDLTIPVKMPLKYVIEMLMDRIAASKIYNKERYTDDLPLIYFLRSYKYIPMNEETKRLLYALLKMLSLYGEEKTFRYIRERLLKKGSY